MEQERTAHARAMAASQGEIMRLREDKAKQLLENLALKDDHNNLQVELMNYRKLLEFEESRYWLWI